MRQVRRSVSYMDEFRRLLRQGLARFGYLVVEEKGALVDACIEQMLANNPATRRRDPEIGFYTYPVTGTPFVLVYDFDDSELRIHYIFHASADRSTLDLTDIEW